MRRLKGDLLPEIIAMAKNAVATIVETNEQKQLNKIAEICEKMSTLSTVGLRHIDNDLVNLLNALNFNITNKAILALALLLRNEVIDKFLADNILKNPAILLSEFTGASLIMKGIPDKNIQANTTKMRDARIRARGRLSPVIDQYILDWKKQEEKTIETIFAKNIFPGQATPLLSPTDKDNLPETIKKIQPLITSIDAYIRKLITARNAVNLCPRGNEEAAVKEITAQYTTAITDLENLKERLFQKKNELDLSLFQNIDELEKKACQLQGSLRAHQQDIAILEEEIKKQEIEQKIPTPPPNGKKPSRWKNISTRWTLEKAKNPKNPTPQLPQAQANNIPHNHLAVALTQISTAEQQEGKNLQTAISNLKQFIFDQLLEFSDGLANIQNEIALSTSDSEKAIADLTLVNDEIALDKFQDIYNQAISIHIKNKTTIQALENKLKVLEKKNSDYLATFKISSADLTLLQKTLLSVKQNSEAQEKCLDLLKNLLITDPRKTAHAFSPLYFQIYEMLKYGEALTKEDLYKGETVLKLASLLTLKANSFFCLPADKQNKAAFQDFQTGFTKLMHSKDEQMAEHRAYWKPLLANIVIALSGIGTLIMLGKLIHSKITTNKLSFFFERTNRQQKLDQVEASFNTLASPAA